MGNIIKDSSGKVLLANSGAFEATAAIDSNIVAGNIKKDVEILGVTGTYEGSGGGGTTAVSLTCAMGASGYYITPNGTVSGIQFDPMTASASFDCMSKTLIYLNNGNANMPPSSLVGATVITSESHGTRPTIYVWILQAD